MYSKSNEIKVRVKIIYCSSLQAKITCGLTTKKTGSALALHTV